MPWDNVVIHGVAWGPLVSVIISFLKALGLDRRWVRWITWLLGFLGLALWQLYQGRPWPAAIVSGLVAVATAPGFYEAFSKPIQRAAIKRAY
ncbi:MAG: hypothetical protein ACM3RP_10960 [Chitinophagales bacterium]